MAKFTKTNLSEGQPGQLLSSGRVTPMQVFIWLTLFGISSAFVFLSIAYFSTTYGTDFNRFEMPFLFHANTVIILVSSYVMAQTRKAVMADDWNGYLNGLMVTTGLALAFTVFQVMGWQQLLRSGITLSNNVAGAYLYVISGLHLAHLLVGMGLLVWFLVTALEKKSDPVKALLFELDATAKARVSLLTTYWHFVDAVWVYLYLFFAFNIYVLR